MAQAMQWQFTRFGDFCGNIVINDQKEQ